MSNEKCKKIQCTKEQKEILASDENTIVTSNPGTGKTTTLALKVIDLMKKGIKPENILCITFTEKAKKQMLDTILDMAKGVFPDADVMKLNIHTFHSFAYNYLVNAGVVTGDIIGNNALRFSLLKSFEQRNAFNYSKEYIISDIMPKTENALRYIKSFGITPDKIDLEKVKEELSGIYEDKKTSYSLEELAAFSKYFTGAYSDYENSKGQTIDYSDMLLLFLKNFKGEQFDYALVDEMQDMNELEAEIAEKVGKKIFLVGDSKQAIFGFQGGSIKNFMKFKQICEPKLLSANRRSVQEILDYSKRHFLLNTKKKEIFLKELDCFKSDMEGAIPRVISTKAKYGRVLKIIEASKGKTIGVITRTNRQLIELSQYLDMNNIEYSSTSSKATTHQAREEIIKFLRGLLFDEIEEKISATFSIFAPYTLKESFEISEAHKKRQDVTRKLKKIEEMGTELTKSGMDDLFNKIIFPVSISKGPEWFSTALLARQQIEEYLSARAPTVEDFFDFLAITEESYLERNFRSKITLTTVHKAKGRDFDVVAYLPSADGRTGFIDMVVEAILKSRGIDIKEELEEESLRIDFVAFTRAKEKLFIITDDKSTRQYHIEGLTEIEVDAEEEEVIATKMNNRLAEAFSLFVSGRMEESKKLLKEEDNWLEEFIFNYFKSLDSLSYSSVKTDPYEFLLDNIIAMPGIFPAMNFGSEVHKAMEDLHRKRVKPEGLQGDVRRAAAENGLAALEKLKKDFPGLEQVNAEKRLLLPLECMTECNKGMMFKGFIDAVFKHDKGFLIVDYKTDKNMNYAADHKRQLSVYRKMFSILEKVPEKNIDIFCLYLALRGGINTGRFEWSVEGENRNAYPTFEKHLKKVLEWKSDPKKFIRELLDKPVDDVLYLAIKEKLEGRKG